MFPIHFNLKMIRYILYSATNITKLFAILIVIAHGILSSN